MASSIRKLDSKIQQSYTNRMSYSMDQNLPLRLQEIIFSSSNANLSRKITRLEKEGQLLKIAPRIYTPHINDNPKDVIRRNIFKIIGHQYPGAVLSHRSAFEYKPSPSGDLFVTARYSRKVELPGLTLNLMKGAPAIPGDNQFTEGLYVSQRERAFLENFEESRNKGGASKTLPSAEIEEKLEHIVRVNGEDALNAIRDRAREISVALGMEKSFKKLNKLINAMLTTKSAQILRSPVAIARAFGDPYDPARIALFEKLFQELQKREFRLLPERNLNHQASQNFALYEAYFSNFIEGTRFRIEEAQEIIQSGKPMFSRDNDSHDVLGTYRIVSNKSEMSITPSTAEELIQLLKDRHRVLLSARVSQLPGELKQKNNYAGDTEFVDWTLVRGTLIQGFNFYRALSSPFAKAAYMMFMISEVHPFSDGNGRLARIMMNAELVKGGQTKIIIPTVFREDYIGALRLLTRQQQPDTYIRMLQRAQLFSATLTGNDLKVMNDILIRSNAFKEGDEYILKVIEAEVS
jgi:Fic family protein